MPSVSEAGAPISAYQRLRNPSPWHAVQRWDVIIVRVKPRLGAEHRQIKRETASEVPMEVVGCAIEERGQIVGMGPIPWRKEGRDPANHRAIESGSADSMEGCLGLSLGRLRACQ